MTTKITNLAPCHKCGRPAMIGDWVGNQWAISCWHRDCDCKPIVYQAGNNRSRAAAARTWNNRSEWLKQRVAKMEAAKLTPARPEKEQS